MHVFDLASGIFTAFFAFLAARASSKAKSASEKNNVVVSQVHASVGETNGETLAELVEGIAEQSRYLHKRNHTIINNQQHLELWLALIGHAVGVEEPPKVEELPE